MIPFGLLCGFAGEKEIRITRLDEKCFGFRMTGEYGGIEECEAGCRNFRLCFYQIRQGNYREITIENYTWIYDQEEKTEFWQGYLVFPEDREGKYRREVQNLFREYSHYINLKLDDDDSELAEELTGYPGKLDFVRCGSLEEQLDGWRKERAGRENLVQNQKELAISLDRPGLYKAYLSGSFAEFVRNYQENVEKVLRDFSFGKEDVKRLYIGNQFCPHLFPEEKLLFEMLEKAWKQSLGVTVVFSYIREEMLDKTAKLLEKLDHWSRQKGSGLEVVVNDWGTAALLKKCTSDLHPCLGILLNKRKKDPRISYKLGDQSWFGTNNLNASFYRDFLEKNFGMMRYEWECCGYEVEFPEGKNSLHLPFYQTNTSSFCPLYAFCTTGKRGRQSLAESCPGYCEERAFLYPEHLHMTSRFNSLFGIDMESADRVKRAAADRIVISLL